MRAHLPDALSPPRFLEHAPLRYRALLLVPGTRRRFAAPHNPLPTCACLFTARSPTYRTATRIDTPRRSTTLLPTPAAPYTVRRACRAAAWVLTAPASPAADAATVVTRYLPRRRSFRLLHVIFRTAACDSLARTLWFCRVAGPPPLNNVSSRNTQQRTALYAGFFLPLVYAISFNAVWLRWTLRGRTAGRTLRAALPPRRFRAAPLSHSAFCACISRAGLVCCAALLNAGFGSTAARAWLRCDLTLPRPAAAAANTAMRGLLRHTERGCCRATHARQRVTRYRAAARISLSHAFHTYGAGCHLHAARLHYLPRLPYLHGLFVRAMT